MDGYVRRFNILNDVKQVPTQSVIAAMSKFSDRSVEKAAVARELSLETLRKWELERSRSSWNQDKRNVQRLARAAAGGASTLRREFDTASGKFDVASDKAASTNVDWDEASFVRAKSPEGSLRAEVSRFDEFGEHWKGEAEGGGIMFHSRTLDDAALIKRGRRRVDAVKEPTSERPRFEMERPGGRVRSPMSSQGAKTERFDYARPGLRPVPHGRKTISTLGIPLIRGSPFAGIL